MIYLEKGYEYRYMVNMIYICIFLIFEVWYFLIGLGLVSEKFFDDINIWDVDDLINYLKNLWMLMFMFKFDL